MENMKVSFFLLLPVMTFAATVTVMTQSGTVIGSTVNFKGRTVKTFLGIPFAQPPVGHLRFKKTVPVQHWRKPLVADTFSLSCKQEYPFDYPWVDRMPGDSEDCLYLNIWVPEAATEEDSKAVMFWIHGGGLSTGSSRQPLYNGQVLAAEGDVIVVTVNYRLGIFGFLSSESEDAPGNMGYFDVLEALKWVNESIQAFGGDKNRITLFGSSSGASMASYFTISPLTEGLFQRIATQSGSAATDRGNTTESNLELGQKVAKAVGCSSDLVTLRNKPKEVIACLREKDADLLTKTDRSFKPTSLRTFFPVFNQEFLPVDPREAIRKCSFQNVDILAGVVKDEGSIYFVTSDPEKWGPYGEVYPRINRTRGADLIRQMFQNHEFKDAVVDYYLSHVNEHDYSVIPSRVYHAQGDYMLICPTLYLVEKFASSGNNAYFYYFEHQYLKSGFAPWMGVTHFTEVPFVFGQPLMNPSYYSQGEIELSKTIIQLWTSFAKDGVPSIQAGQVRHRCSSDWWTMAYPLNYNVYTQSYRNKFYSLKTSWKQYPYIQEFYIRKPCEDYVKHHQRNCEFFRPFYRL